MKQGGNGAAVEKTECQRQFFRAPQEGGQKSLFLRQQKTLVKTSAFFLAEGYEPEHCVFDFFSTICYNHFKTELWEKYYEKNI